MDMGFAIYVYSPIYAYRISYTDIASAISIWRVLYVYRLCYMHMVYAICIEADVSTKRDGG